MFGSPTLNYNNILNGIVIVLILLILYHYYANSISNSFRVWSIVDNEYHNVHDTKNIEDMTQAADLMAMINKRNIELLKYVKEKLKHGKYNPMQADIIQYLLRNYNPDQIVENAPKNVSNDTSYTTNKGELLAVCLRRKDSFDKKPEGEFQALNTMMYVSIHEMAHMGTREYGHGDVFWKNFAFLLREGVSAGVYKAVDYSKYPEHYCGLNINSSPLFPH
jgi:hypothetical protein